MHNSSGSQTGEKSDIEKKDVNNVDVLVLLVFSESFISKEIISCQNFNPSQIDNGMSFTYIDMPFPHQVSVKQKWNVRYYGLSVHFSSRMSRVRIAQVFYV